MKRLFSFLLALMMAFSMAACGVTEVTAPSTEPSETIEDLNANAIAILEDMIGERVGDSDFIDVVLAYVPDVFMLKEYRCACWTYFLVMEDGLEYIVITDYDGKITSICEWYPYDGTHGATLYEDYPEE